jgi:hypothetical protein
MRLEELGKSKTSIHHIEIRIRDIPACRMVHKVTLRSISAAVHAVPSLLAWSRCWKAGQTHLTRFKLEEAEASMKIGASFLRGICN